MSFKKLLITAAALALLLTPVLWTAGNSARTAEAQAPSQRTITVTGYGNAYGVPDVAMLGLGVDSLNADILAAMNDSNARMNAVLQALQQNGVDPKDIRTDYFSIYQDYSGAVTAPTMENGQPAPVYRVSTSVTVTVRDTNQVAGLLAAAVSAGANIVNYVQFDIADRAALEGEARSQAIADAQDRAAQIASTLGLTVGEPQSIVEGSGLGVGPQFSAGGGGGGMGLGGAPSISQGQLSVSMAVTITFAVQ